MSKLERIVDALEQKAQRRRKKALTIGDIWHLTILPPPEESDEENADDQSDKPDKPDGEIAHRGGWE